MNKKIGLIVGLILGCTGFFLCLSFATGRAQVVHLGRVNPELAITPINQPINDFSQFPNSNDWFFVRCTQNTTQPDGSFNTVNMVLSFSGGDSPWLWRHIRLHAYPDFLNTNAPFTPFVQRWTLPGEYITNGQVTFGVANSPVPHSIGDVWYLQCLVKNDDGTVSASQGLQVTWLP